MRIKGLNKHSYQTAVSALGRSCALLAVSVLLTGCWLEPMNGSSASVPRGESWEMPGKVQSERLQQNVQGRTAASRPEFQPRGLNLRDYFAYDIKNPIERTRRTEHAILALESQINALQAEVMRMKQSGAYAPHPSSVARVPAATSAPKKIAPAPQTKPPAPQAASSAPRTPAPQASAPKAPVASGPMNVSQFRVGEHADKTRLVFDTNAEIPYRYDLDNRERLLVIDLPGVEWDAIDKSVIAKSPLVAGYNTYDGANGGTTLVLQLKDETRVIKEAMIKPNNISPYHRLVIDLSK